MLLRRYSREFREDPAYVKRLRRLIENDLMYIQFYTERNGTVGPHINLAVLIRFNIEPTKFNIRPIILLFACTYGTDVINKILDN